jgi:hypothetical protein
VSLNNRSVVRKAVRQLQFHWGRQRRDPVRDSDGYSDLNPWYPRPRTPHASGFASIGRLIFQATGQFRPLGPRGAHICPRNRCIPVSLVARNFPCKRLRIKRIGRLCRVLDYAEKKPMRPLWSRNDSPSRLRLLGVIRKDHRVRNCGWPSSCQRVQNETGRYLRGTTGLGPENRLACRLPSGRDRSASDAVQLRPQ